MIRIRELREARGLQQKQLSIDLGVSQPTISDWESGRKHPSSKSVAKIADYFDVSIDYLLSRADNPDMPDTHKENLTSLAPPPPTIEDVLKHEGITNPEYINSLKNIIELMRRDEHNADFADEFTPKEYGTK